jgi:hypothetical protein
MSKCGLRGLNRRLCRAYVSGKGAAVVLRDVFARMGSALMIDCVDYVPHVLWDVGAIGQIVHNQGKVAVSPILFIQKPVGFPGKIIGDDRGIDARFEQTPLPGLCFGQGGGCSVKGCVCQDGVCSHDRLCGLCAPCSGV